MQFAITTAQNWRANNINRTPQQKVIKLKSKFSLTLGYLNRALNNPALAAKNNYTARKKDPSYNYSLCYLLEGADSLAVCSRENKNSQTKGSLLCFRSLLSVRGNNKVILKWVELSPRVNFARPLFSLTIHFAVINTQDFRRRKSSCWCSVR